MSAPVRFMWHVTQLTPEEAESFDRRAYGVTSPERLGWTPYTYRVTYGAVAQWAGHTAEEFARFLSTNRLAEPTWSAWNNGIRYATLIELPPKTEGVK